MTVALREPPSTPVPLRRPVRLTPRPVIEKKVRSLHKDQRRRLLSLAIPRIVEPYFKHIPHPAQQVFLSLNSRREAFFGGAAGGGKSDAVLMSALQYVDVPGYAALILRRTWPDLILPGAIMDRANEWLMDTPAQKRDGGRLWVFPSGARLQFGYLQHDNNKYRYQSAEFQFIGFDELTQFPDEDTYSYLFSRCRRPSVKCLNCNTSVTRLRNVKDRKIRFRHTTREGRDKCHHIFPDPKAMEQYPDAPDGTSIFEVPLRVRSASNPGGRGHEWVKERFIDLKTRREDTVFVPSKLKDNPSVDQESYRESLSYLNEVDRQRLEDGNWDVSEPGEMFDRSNFEYVEKVPKNVVRWVRYWDKAATENESSDWTVGALCGITNDNEFVIVDIVRVQERSAGTERTIKATALMDTPHIPIRQEQEPGSAGLDVIDYYRRRVLMGWNYDGIRSSGSKVTRASTLAAFCKGKGNVKVVVAEWNRKFINEMEAFPNGSHDDQVDAVSGGFNFLMSTRMARLLN